MSHRPESGRARVVNAVGEALGPVLIANRGEIALRIVRACRDAGLLSIATYADGEADAPFVVAADQALALGGSSAAETYLDGAKLLAAAAEAGARAVHPGYGFLAEVADFADAVAAAGLVWIGPPAPVLRMLGDKVAARALATAAGVAVMAGTDETVADADAVTEFAEAHGLPVIIKAAHGGGGRGLRVVHRLADIPTLWATAASEATSSFGRPACFVERYVERARHVEVQVIADQFGAVVAIGDRDCTVQRRHQKLVEEAPAPFLDDDQRALLHAAAAAVCRAAGYVGVGTVEFLLDEDGAPWFLEVNARLQVEHGVTEEVAGIDLVGEQFRIAAGAPLSVEAATAPRRHAIELRITAEDASRGFLPGAGRLARVELPSGPGVRVDAGVATGSVVGDRFDSLLAKLIVVGADRQQALARARRALAEVRIDGVPSVVGFLRGVLDHPDFTAVDGQLRVHTRWTESDPPPIEAERASPADDGALAVPIGGRWLDVAVPGIAAAASGPLVAARASTRQRRARAEVASLDAVIAPMQATVVRIEVADGDIVAGGELVVVLEAMKMEHTLLAPCAGTVTGLAVAAGDSVANGDVLCRIVGGRGPGPA